MFTPVIIVLYLADLFVRPTQVSQLRERLTAVKKVLESKDDMSAEDIKKEVTELQQQSLKLFEMAYKKVSGLAASRD